MNAYDLIPDDWYADTLAEWKTKLAALGYANADIRFSGFGSQGDGASFAANVTHATIAARMTDALRDQIEAARIAEALANPRYESWRWEDIPDKIFLSLTIDGGHYVHARMMSYQLGIDDLPDNAPLNEWLDTLGDDILTEARALADQIYRELDAEYFALYQAAEAEAA